MIDFLLVMTAATLTVANVLIWRKPAILPRIGLGLTWAGIVGFSFCIGSLLLLMQTFGIALALVGLSVPRYGRTVASTLTVVACLGAWGFMALHSADHWQKIDLLQAEYPLLSVEERLPQPHQTTPFRDEDLTKFEQSVGASAPSQNQNWYWELLHDEHAKSFGRTPGFGPARMITPLWMKSQMRRNTERPEPIPQPHPLRDEIEPTGDAWSDAKLRDFFNFHAGSIGSFANFKGFGYLKSRREVAGFAPHAFESEPKPQVPYTLERLELVGLVRNPEPAVYVSEFLPRMTELDAVTTRPADGFEAAGLKRLAAGEDLVAVAVGSKVRLLGAIRNMAACVECHGGQRGDLLGAFSYRLAEAK